MAGNICLCDPGELYNILNQSTRVPRLSELNYLYLIDAREKQDFFSGHIITAKNATRNTDGAFTVPEGIELETMQYIVVYDSDTHSLQGSGEATVCAEVLAKATLSTIHILNGGYQKFSALFLFYRTTEVMYTIQALENLKPYPVEILPGLLYMGDHKQATDHIIVKDLKINALVNISESNTIEFEKGNQSVLYIGATDSATADLYSSFERISAFIGTYLSMGSRVLICSSHGISRCSAVTMAFLIHHLKYSLKEAWQHVLKCKHNMRPNRGFVQQLSDWEIHTMERRLTDISEPNF